MPKLYIFAACEKVVIDQAGTASLISLFNKITGTLPPDSKLPADAVVPKEWAIFTSWTSEPGDEGKEYVQCIQILYPDGAVFKESKDSKFKMESEIKRSQVNIQVPVFPVGQAGPYTVRMWLEREGVALTEPQSFHIEVVLNRAGGSSEKT